MAGNIARFAAGGHQPTGRHEISQSAKVCVLFVLVDGAAAAAAAAAGVAVTGRLLVLLIVLKV